MLSGSRSYKTLRLKQREKNDANYSMSVKVYWPKYNNQLNNNEKLTRHDKWQDLKKQSQILHFNWTVQSNLFQSLIVSGIENQTVPKRGCCLCSSLTNKSLILKLFFILIFLLNIIKIIWLSIFCSLRFVDKKH